MGTGWNPKFTRYMLLLFGIAIVLILALKLYNG